MASPVTITCPGCRVAFAVPARVVRVFGHQVVVSMDRTEVYGHMAACPALTTTPAPAQEANTIMAVPEDKPNTELVGRIHLMLSGGHFMAKGGSGACTMCGVGRDGCLSGVKLRRTACCGACGDGNTHPAPMESRGTCAEWGAEHGARN